MTTINESLIPFPCAPENKPSRSRRPVGAVLHHMAGYLPGTDGIFRNPDTGYATNLGIGSLDGQNYIVHEYVPEGEVAWGNGNDDLNARAISIEHENNRAEGPASKPTPEVHELSARTLARQARQWDWRIGGKVQLVLRDFPNHDFYERSVPGFGVEFNVTGHRSVALKNCPNELDMVWIVNRANELLAGGGASKEEDMAQGAFYRIADGQTGAGGIYWQEAPGLPLIPLDGSTWAAYAANGNKFVNLSRAQIDGIIARCGTATKPAGAVVNVGDIAAPQIDYEALAKAFLNEQARRLAS